LFPRRKLPRTRLPTILPAARLLLINFGKAPAVFDSGSGSPYRTRQASNPEETGATSGSARKPWPGEANSQCKKLPSCGVLKLSVCMGSTATVPLDSSKPGIRLLDKGPSCNPSALKWPNNGDRVLRVSMLSSPAMRCIHVYVGQTRGSTWQFQGFPSSVSRWQSPGHLASQQQPQGLSESSKRHCLCLKRTNTPGANSRRRFAPGQPLLRAFACPLNFRPSPFSPTHLGGALSARGTTPLELGISLGV
jgi:hypothetical protein